MNPVERTTSAISRWFSSVQLTTLRVLLGGLVVLWVVLTFVVVHEQVPPTQATPNGIDKVVVFGIPGLSFDALQPSTMPNLVDLSKRGAVAGANVRTGGNHPAIGEAYASLGASAPLDTDATGSIANPGTSPTGESTLWVSDMPQFRNRKGIAETGHPGALADALHGSKRRIAVVSNADVRAANGTIERATPAALAAASSSGAIDSGQVGADLVRRAPEAAGGLQADPDRFAADVERAMASNDVVIVDPGDTSRLTEAEHDGTPAQRASALHRTDVILGRVADGLDEHTLLLIVGVTPSGSFWQLTPVVAVGGGVEPGHLHSPSTHRRDLVTLLDVAPTVLSVLGIETPSTMSGHALRLRPGQPSMTAISSFDDMLVGRRGTDQPMTLIFILVQSLLYLLALIALVRKVESDRIHRLLIYLVLTCAAWPLATFLIRLDQQLYTLGGWTNVLTWAIAGCVAAVAMRLRTHPLDPLLVICGLTVLTLVADLSTGAHLQYGSFFGYAPNKGTRFVGLGNAAFALLTSSTIVVCTALVARAKRRDAAWWVAVAVALVVATADGIPWMGADVGGIIATIPIFGLMLWALSGRPIKWRTLLMAGAAAAVALAIAVGLDSLRSPDQRTHMSRFFLQLGHPDLMWAMIAHKWSANMRLLRQSMWAWLVPVTVAFSVCTLTLGRAWQRVLPSRSAERIGVVATLVLALAGWLLNDSGIVVVALTSMYLGPYILLLAYSANSGFSATIPGSKVQVDENDAAAVGDATSGLAKAPERSQTKVVSSMPVSNMNQDSDAPNVVAIVPAKDRADSVADTVRALLRVDAIDRVVVVDDGSRDNTWEVASSAGADVLRLPVNVGKGGAVARAVAASPEADIYLLIDADLARTAGAADLLLAPVLDDLADLTIGVLPSAGGRGGFGIIKKMSARGVRRACGLDLRAPLSGQRALRAKWLRDGLPSSGRFGLEVAMSIDVARGGGRVLEVDVPMDHRHTGRSVSGFAHRGRQGFDILRSLWPRVTDARQRLGAIALLTLLVCAGAVVLGSSTEPATKPLGTKPTKVLMFGMQPFGFDDLSLGITPNVQRLVDRGAIGAMSVRTVSRVPSETEGYLSIGAGARIRTAGQAPLVVDAESMVGGMTARQYVKSLTGVEPKGDLVAIGGPAIARRNEGPQAVSDAGTLATVLEGAGHLSGATANSDHPADINGKPLKVRSAALAAMGTDFGVARGRVDAPKLLMEDATAPFGVRANPGKFVNSVKNQLKSADFVVVDPGDLSRAQAFGGGALDDAKSTMWDTALRNTDALLGRIVKVAGPDTLILVVSVRPTHGQTRLTPMVAAGPGVPKGMISSPSTQRPGVVALTDIAPTVVGALGVDDPADLPGNAVRYQPGSHHLSLLKSYDADTVVRERTYYGLTQWFIWIEAAVLGLVLFVISKRPRFVRAGPALRWAVLALASFPVATFLVRAIPGLTSWFFVAQPIISVAIAALIGWFASRRRSHPLAGYAWVCGITVVVMAVDLWTGAHLELSTWLGYSLHNAGRFYGIPNSSFAVFGACAMVLAGIVVNRSERRTEATWAMAGMLLVVMISAGFPMLGANVGALITLGPTFALLVVALLGHKIKIKNVLLAGVGMVLLVVAAAGIDLARPAPDRSHLGRFASDFINDGPGVLFGAFVRKQNANFRILQSSIWSRLIPIAALFSFVPLVWERRSREVFPVGSTLQIAAWAVIGGSLLGFAANDSGPIIVALFVVFLPPLIALPLLSRHDPKVTFIPATSDSDRASEMRSTSAGPVADPESPVQA